MSDVELIHDEIEKEISQCQCRNPFRADNDRGRQIQGEFAENKCYICFTFNELHIYGVIM